MVSFDEGGWQLIIELGRKIPCKRIAAGDRINWHCTVHGIKIS
jgi:hypothetical protein